MSSFTCEKCCVDNLDSDRGYIQGCAHWPPERDGRYLVVIERREHPRVVNGAYSATRIYKDGKWDVHSYEKVIVWSEVDA